MKVSIDKIVVPKVRASSRLTPEQQAFFEGTVKKYGVLQPILVRPLGRGRYELIAGKTRLEELRKAGAGEVEVRVIKASVKDALLMHLAENYARGSVEPISTAKVIQKALNEGSTVEEIAAIFNHTPDWVRFMVSLLKLPEAYQDALREGKIKVTHVREAFRLPDLREVDAALSAAVTHGWSTSMMHNYVNNRLVEFEAAAAKSRSTGVEVPPPPPEPERLVRYGQCLVCGQMVPRETIRLPSVCEGCYGLSKYVVSQFGSGEKAMEAIYGMYQRARAWDALQKPITIQAPTAPSAEPEKPEVPAGPLPSTVPERSTPISDDRLRNLVKKILRAELERQEG